jgi:hypothetical protein
MNENIKNRSNNLTVKEPEKEETTVGQSSAITKMETCTREAKVFQTLENSFYTG